jgi:hypothetical protein
MRHFNKERLSKFEIQDKDVLKLARKAKRASFFIYKELFKEKEE